MVDDLAAAIRKRRLELNLSQRETAAQLGVSERTLQSWEGGHAFPWPRHRRTLERWLSREEVKAR